MGRASDREVVLTRPLRKKMVALNPGVPAAAYDETSILDTHELRLLYSAVATNSRD